MKKCLIPVIALLMITAATFTARADWVQNGSDYYYYYGETLATNQLIDDEYYVDSTGKMVTDQWIQATDTEGTFYYYFGSNGKMIRDKWKTINEKTYHFDDEGRMETGWILDNMYFCHYNDGHMLTGWQRLEDPDEFSDEHSGPAIGDDGNIHYYYFSNSGKKYCADDTDFIEKRIDGKRYCFNRIGALQTGWVQVSDADGIGGYKYYDENGIDHVGWYSLYPPEELSNNYPYDVMWFYFNTNGTPAYDTDGIPTISDMKRIDSKRYYFNEYGTPVWGLCKIYTATDGGDYETYFFGTFNQCYAQSGKFTITEGDGTKNSFYFSQNGMGYTGVHSGELYWKGKLQKATSDEKYAVIKVANKNYLVSTAGKVEKKKTCKDADGVKWTTDSNGIVIKKDDVEWSGNGRDPEAPNFE